MSRRLRDEAWQRIRDGLDVSGSAKVLLLAIAELCDGELRAKEETLAELIGKSPRQVGRLRRELIDAGCLVQTARAAPGRVARFDVLPDEQTPDTAWPTNAGHPMADVEGTHPLQRRTSSSERRTTDGRRTPDNGWPTEPQVEPEEPAAALTDDESLALAIEETRRIDAQRRANGGEPIEDVNAYAAVKARDQTWRAGVEAEREKKRTEVEAKARRDACPRCDDTGRYWVRSDGTRTTRDDPEGHELRFCQHVEELTA